MTGAGSNDDALDEPLPPGTLVAERYRIEGLLGEGGMGRVYSAVHVHLRKRVALKVLHPGMSHNPEIVARFEREAMAAASIEHPNIAAGTDLGTLGDGEGGDGALFLVLEFVAGRTLRSELSGGALEPRRAVRIVRGIVSAIAAAHAKGIIHRDLKPENVMLVERGGDPDFVKVLDFGIAKTVSLDERSGATVFRPLTRAGSVLGTPDYMPPEQALGEPVDARSDLYAIGVIFFELLTGDRPFKGELIDLLRQQILTKPPPLPPSVAQTVGPELGVLVAKVLSKSPADRPPSAQALLEALDRAVSPASLGAPAPPTRSRTSAARPTGAEARTADPATPSAPRPRPWLLGVVGLAALLTLAAGIGVARRVAPSLTGLGHDAPTSLAVAVGGGAVGAAQAAPPVASDVAPADTMGSLSAPAPALPPPPAPVQAPAPSARPSAAATRASQANRGPSSKDSADSNGASGRSIDANGAGIHIHVALPEKLLNRLR